MTDLRHSNVRAILFAGGLAVLCVLWRLWPHAPNVAPVAALALFVAWATGRAWLGAALAGLVMLVSDLIVGLYDLRLQMVVWGALMLPALYAKLLPSGPVRALAPALGVSVLGALSFFVLTNGAVWAFGDAYAPGPDGLLASLTAGLPFLRGTLTGDLLWTAALFGGAALTQLAGRVRAARAPAHP